MSSVRWHSAIVLLLISILSAVEAPSQALTVPNRSSSQKGNAVESKPADPLRRETPAGDVRGFLSAAAAKNYERAAQYLQLTTPMKEEEQLLIDQLRAVFDSGVIDPSRLSNDPRGRVKDEVEEGRDLIGRVLTPNDEYPIEIVRVDDPEFGLIWLISSETVSNVPAMYESLNGGFRSQLPSWLTQHRFLTLELWEWIGLLCLIAISIFGGRLLSKLIVRQLAVRLAKAHGPAMIRAAERLTAPVQWCAAILIYRVFVPLLLFPLRASVLSHRISTIALILLFTWLFVHVVDIFSERFRIWLVRSERIGGISILPMMRRTTKVLVAIIGLAVLFEFVGISVTSLWAGLGIGGIAIALAAQKTVENLFGGASLIADQPVRVGDVCRFDNQTGVIEDIGLRSTKVRTPARSVVSIPNGTFAAMQLENLSQRDRLLFLQRVQITYDATVDLTRYLLVEIRKLLYSHSMVYRDPARVRLVAFGAYSLDIEIFAYIKTADNDEFLAVQEDLLLRIMTIVDQAGARLAIPSQNNYVARQNRPDGRAEAAEQIVHELRERGDLPLPHFSHEQINRIKDTLKYPLDRPVMNAS